MVPAKSGSNRKTDSHAKTWLLPDQVESLRDACLDCFWDYLQDRNEAIIAVLYDTGIRVGELVDLDVANINLDEASVYLPREIQKGNAPPATLEFGLWGDVGTTRLLRRYLRDRDALTQTGALFPSRQADRITPTQVRRIVRSAAQEADVSPMLAEGGTGEPDDVTPHTLRHSLAYRIIQVEGGRLEDVQLRLRHASRSTTDEIYSHLIPR